jgi:AcrR family transcriptional regulator
MTSDSSSRPYRKIKRARREAATRERITEAAVELHRTVGPAKTKITALAKLAGVSRMTVYNHFPSERDLFVACSTHWATRNPFPDPSQWSRINDPAERLASGLNELYVWYRRNKDMLGNVFRDAPTMSPLQEVMGELWSPYAEQLVASLADGWPAPEDETAALQTALGLVVSFETWRALVGPGLDDSQAANLAVRMVAGAFAPPG